MAEEWVQGELNNLFHFFVSEDKDLEGRSLNWVVTQMISEQFQTYLRLQLLLKHPLEDVVHDSEHGRYLLVAEGVLLAESVVHGVEVKFEELNLRRRFVRSHWQDALQAEDLGQSASLLRVGLCLPQILGLVLVELGVQEELSFARFTALTWIGCWYLSFGFVFNNVEQLFL